MGSRSMDIGGKGGKIGVKASICHQTKNQHTGAMRRAMNSSVGRIDGRSELICYCSISALACNALGQDMIRYVRRCFRVC